MLGVYSNALKVKDIRRKLLYIMFVLLVFRIGSAIPLPGIDMELLNAMMLGQDAGILGMIIGGEHGSIFAMGIGPYITASIIMQLLTVAIPKLEQLKKEGEEGRKKINQITRILAVVMAVLQASGTVFSQRFVFLDGHQNLFVYFVAALTMVAGTMFIMWMSELLTEKAIGNGASFIIFANILSALPGGVMTLYYASLGGVGNAIVVVIVIILFVFVVGFAVLVQDGQRKIPVQYSKKMVGRQTYGGQSSFIPVKVNIAGVMSIIFAMSILGFPMQIAMFFPLAEGADPRVLDHIVNFLHMTGFTYIGIVPVPFGAMIYVLLIFAFTFFYTSFAVNPVEMAENLKKNGGFIPGIRPGKPTSDYIARTVNRLSWIGAVFYSVIAMIPVVIEWVTGIVVGFGGTTLLIVVGVALELVKQLESQLLMRNYKGFLKD
ncbi:MAG: preprotein translocase subunit SecY [Clostridiales bacterium]|jgi:preprotein translocase subunit SecY|nr:preprotein translocase subunit SecY [Clostridiales bacterium]